MNKSNILSALFLSVIFNTNAQSTQTLKPINFEENKKGTIFFYWGWNEETYTNSDIHFWGNNYDFTLLDVAAKDKQSNFDPNLYFGISNITIPQYNWRVGYYLSNKYQISVGFDHMKYVMINDQPSTINGYIHKGTEFDGDFQNQQFNISQNFLLFEHTDGLNYINTEIRRAHHLYSNKYIALNINGGIGAGILFPKTNATLMHNDRNDEWHLSGFGVAGVVSAQLKIKNRLFIQTEYKLGYINMPDIKTTRFASDKASQQFGFSQYNIVFGAEFPLIKQ